MTKLDFAEIAEVPLDLVRGGNVFGLPGDNYLRALRLQYQAACIALANPSSERAWQLEQSASDARTQAWNLLQPHVAPYRGGDGGYAGDGGYGGYAGDGGYGGYGFDDRGWT